MIVWKLCAFFAWPWFDHDFCRIRAAFLFRKKLCVSGGKKTWRIHFVLVVVVVAAVVVWPVDRWFTYSKKTSSTMNVTLQMIHLFIDDSPIPKKITKTTVMAQLWVFMRGFLMAITCSNPAGPRCHPPRPLCPPGRPGLWPHDIAWSEYKAPPVRCAAAAGTFSGINGGVVVCFFSATYEGFGVVDCFLSVFIVDGEFEWDMTVEFWLYSFFSAIY